MEKYSIYLSLKEEMVEKFKFSDRGDDLDELIAKLERLLAIYKSKKL